MLSLAGIVLRIYPAHRQMAPEELVKDGQLTPGEARLADVISKTYFGRGARLGLGDFGVGAVRSGELRAGLSLDRRRL
jgi:hypothetical protein